MVKKLKLAPTHFFLFRPISLCIGLLCKNYLFYLWMLKYIPSKVHAYLGYVNACLIYRYASKKVPAYQDYLGKRCSIAVPETDKSAYILNYSIQDRCCNGKLLKRNAMIDESSGSSGQPFNWVRGDRERKETHHFVQYYCRYNFGDSFFITLNAFSQGAWATGWNMGLSLQKNGIVKNTGPDVHKILKTLAYLGPDFDYLILGYPPFLKLLIDEAEKQNFPLKRFRLLALVGGEGMSEGLRDYLKTIFAKVYSGFGATDLEMGVAGESDISISLRRLAESDVRVKEALFGKDSRSPMVFQYNPFLYFIEANSHNELVYTICRPSLMSPRVRYNVHDKGGIATFNEVESKLALLGYDISTLDGGTLALPLPFMWIHGRSDYTVSVMGANIYPEDIEYCVYAIPALAKITISYCLSSIEIEKGLLRPFIMLEVHTIPSETETKYLADTLLKTLIALNSDFESGYKEYPDILIPKIDYYLEGDGPFKRSLGQIKQKRLMTSYTSAI